MPLGNALWSYFDGIQKTEFTGLAGEALSMWWQNQPMWSMYGRTLDPVSERVRHIFHTFGKTCAYSQKKEAEVLKTSQEEN